MRRLTRTRERDLLQDLAQCAYSSRQRSAQLCEMLLGDGSVADTPSICFAAAMARLTAIDTGTTGLNWGRMGQWTDGRWREVTVPKGRERVFSSSPTA